MLKRYRFVDGFESVIGSNNEYFIDNNGKIVDKEEKVVKSTEDSDGYSLIRCLAWDGYRLYRAIDLVAIQFKNLFIPTEDLNKVVAFVIDGDKKNLHASNVGYRFTGGKLESKTYPGFYYIPGLTSLLINEHGEMRNSKTGAKISQRIMKRNEKINSAGGYRRAVGMFEKGRHHSILRHRALCLVFKDYPDNVDSMTVNHINGIPGQDDILNLEWATYSRNIQHAHETGLINWSKPVLVRDAITGTVTEYYSISECGRFLNLDKSVVWNRLHSSRFGKVFYDGTQIKYKSDSRHWVIPSDPVDEIRKSQLSIPINARNLLTNESRTFSSIAKAGIFIHKKYLRDVLANGKQPLFASGWQFKKENEDWKEIDDLDQVLYKLQNEVMARNEDTGVIYIANSSEKMADVLNLKSWAVRTAALTRGNKIYGGFRFRLGVTTEPWPITNNTYKGEKP